MASTLTSMMEVNEFSADDMKKLSNFTMMVKSAGLMTKKHQQEAILWCLNKETDTTPVYEGVRGGLIADEMGLGKTIQVIGTMLCNPKYNTLIVLPYPLLEQWRKEIKRTTGHDVLVYHGAIRNSYTQEYIKSCPIVLTTYNTIAEKSITKATAVRKECLLYKINWDRIVFDEAHHLRNPSTKMFKAAEKISRGVEIRWLLTGTPIQNRRRDFYSLCEIIGISSKHYKDENEVKTTIASNFLLKRTKKQVNIDIPELITHPTTQVAWKNDTERQLSADFHAILNFSYVSPEEDADGDNSTNPRTQRDTNREIAFLDASSRPTTLPCLMRCRQACILPKLLKNFMQKCQEEGILDEDLTDADLKAALEATSKMDAVVNKITEVKSRTNTTTTTTATATTPKFLIFCHFRGEIDLLRERLSDMGMTVNTLDGRTSKVSREQVLTTDNADVLILQIQAGCEGLNLQNYNKVMFVSPHWNPAVEDQAIARAWRLGQKNQVEVFRFEMENHGATSRTIDAYCTKVQEDKREMRKILSGAASGRRIIRKPTQTPE